MKIINKLTYAILLALGTAPAMADNITGKVTDISGNPVTSGEVSIEGTPFKTDIKKDGSFSFTSVGTGEVKLHVASSKYVHEHMTYTVPAAGLTDVTFALTDASIEILDVTAVPFHVSTLEGTLPVNVLAGDELDRQLESSLGDTLANEIGIHSSSHGGVVSTPIIRGLSGPRVLITQNGLDASDVSRVGPDHIVTTEASTAQQIEILRGPATLFYGSGAIGGVVNVVDNRIPSSEVDEGEVAVSTNTNNKEEAISGSIVSTQGNFVFSAGGFYREADEYEIPGMAELEEDYDDDHDDHDDDHEHGGNIVENSDYRNTGFNIGGSYLFDTGFIGFSVENQSSFYGIPGHAHGGEEHGHEEDEDEHEGEEHEEEEEVVNLDMNQDRYQLKGGFQFSGDVLSSVNFSAGYTDYEHIELENGERGTMFANQSTELRVETMHHNMSGWEGGLSFQYKKSDIEALGEEAFTPASETTMLSLGLFEEKEMGDFLVQLGARIERVELDVPALFETDVELLEDDHHDDDGHDEDHDDEHDEEHEHGDMPGSISESYTPISISGGVVWNYAQGYNAAVSIGRSQRVPSAAELFSLGPHLGSGNFEIGALYDIDEEEHVVAGAIDFDLETSNSIDLTLRKYEGDLGIIFNLFYNKVDNYYFDANTGFFAEFEHEHGDEEHDDEHGDEGHDDEHGDEEHDDEHDEEGELLPVILFTSTDATIYGAELQVNYRLSDELTLRTQADMVRTRIDTVSGTTEAPRTPPMRWFASAEYQTNDFYFDVKLKHVFEQDKVSFFESATDSYTLLDMNFSYYLPFEQAEVELFFKGRNLTDEEARVHTSYLRSEAPLPGRSFILGVRANF